MYVLPFDKFPFNEFVKEKKLEVAELRPWIDYDTKQRLGTLVKVSIAEDKSEYPPSSTGEIRTNYREVFTVKVHKENVAVKRGDLVRFVRVDAKIIGDYRNELKVEAEDVVLDSDINVKKEDKK